MKPIVRAIEHNTHAGEILFFDIIKPNNLTITEVATLLGVSRSNLSKIVNGKSAITPQMAIRISKVFGGTAILWVNLQSSFDLRKAEEEWKFQNISLDKFEYANQA